MDVPLEALRALCDRLRRELGAAGCLLSRAVGDLLILVAEDAELRGVHVGRVYLISEYPATRRVLGERVALTLTLADEDADAHERALLEELGFWSLLMLPLELAGDAWGLVELYGERGRTFSGADADRALALVGEAARELQELRAAG